MQKVAPINLPRNHGEFGAFSLEFSPGVCSVNTHTWGGQDLKRPCVVYFIVLAFCAGARADTRGDVNGDGLADGRDVAALTGLLTGASGAAGGRGDLNCDGQVNAADVAILLRGLVEGFPSTETSPSGDLNGDNARDGRDVTVFVSVFTGADTDPAHVAAADLNQNGQVDAVDLPAFVHLLIGAPSGVGVPPATLGDVDGDHHRSGRDVQAFMAVLSGQDDDAEHFASADMTQDGAVTAADVPAFLARVLTQTGPLPSEWTPPIGVPMPEFGIHQTHYLFADATYNFGFGCEPYRDAGHGPYTHYVDNTHPESTDSDNPFGTPGRPRNSIPYFLLPGSVVELHGGPYESYFEIRDAGTAERPIFIRGVDPLQPVLFKAKLLVLPPSRYLILENLAVDRDYQSSGVNIEGVSYIAIRDCEIYDAQGGILVYGASDSSIDHIVVCRNHIHDLGDLSVVDDIDDNGIQVGGGASDIWVVDNLVHHTVGSGIVLNPGFEFGNEAIQRVYVGRNTVHHSRQSGCWTKQSSDAIFSQNTVHSIIGTSFAISTGLGFQYGPERTWFIFNHVFDCEYGIGSGSNNVPAPGLEQFFVGNVIHDVHHRAGEYQPDSPWASAAMMLVGGEHRLIVNNTIYHCDAGINGPGPGSYLMENNLIADMLEPAANHVFIENELNDVTWDLRYSCLFDSSGPVRVRERSHVYDLDGLAEINKGSGCVSVPPGFVSPEGLDFHLLPGSPVVDAGIETFAYDRFEALYGRSIRVDFDGRIRPQAGAFDMGAYERP